MGVDILLSMVMLNYAPHVLDLAVHLFGWMGKGDHSETLLLLVLFYQSTPSWLKVIGWVGAGVINEIFCFIVGDRSF